MGKAAAKTKFLCVHDDRVGEGDTLIEAFNNCEYAEMDAIDECEFYEVPANGIKVEMQLVQLPTIVQV